MNSISNRQGLLGLLFVLPVLLHAQIPDQLQSERDSLKSELLKALADSTLVGVNLDLTWIYYRFNTDSAIYFAQKALEAAEHGQYGPGLSESYGWLGYLYNDKSEFTKGLEYLHLGLDEAEKNENLEEQATILNNIGMSHDFLEDFETAKSFYHKALKLHNSLGVMHNVGIITGNIASIENRQGNHELAYKLNARSVVIFDSIGDEANLALTLNNIGNMLKIENRYDTALTLFNRAAEIFERFKYRKSLALAYANASDCYYQLGMIDKAKLYGEKSFTLAKELDIPESIMNATGFLYKIYKRQGKHEQALAMHELHVRMEDSVVNERSQKEAIRKQLTYDYEKEALADSIAFVQQQTLERLEHQAKLESEKNQRYMLYGGIGFLAIIGLVSLRAYQRKKRDHKLISEQKRQTEFQKEQIEEAHKEITDSIAYAKRIQTAILPSDRIVKEHLANSFILYKPKDVVAGDFYWLEKVGDVVYFAAADCTGHGVPGAMVSVVCVNGLNRSVREFGFREPGEILDRTRELVIKEFEKSEEEVKDGMDISLCALNTKTRQLKWAGANNPLWLVRSGAKEIEEIKADKQPIGKFELSKPFTTHDIKLSEGDTVYIFSDGFPDQFGGERGKKYKSGNFKRTLLGLSQKPISVQEELLDQEFEAWRGDIEQIDDVCVIGVKI